eukprot:365534-Chlamydomonas_euryale.AAC.24
MERMEAKYGAAAAAAGCYVASAAGFDSVPGDLGTVLAQRQGLGRGPFGGKPGHHAGAVKGRGGGGMFVVCARVHPASGQQPRPMLDNGLPSPPSLPLPTPFRVRSSAT